ncbi:MAG: glycosyltransferase family 39 protein, partial [Actinomycetota bacterium]|nr:glycosyltransferase family 39 protein [Actinomycetota bacterium]
MAVAAARDEPRAWSLPVPTWALVGGVFALSFVLRLVFALRDPAPWIFNDEIQYSELAKSLGHTGQLAIREVEGTGGFGLFYPALLAPAFALFDAVPDAYDAAKAINSVLMSATVVPVYLLARRVAGRGWSLAAAGFSVLVPALMLTGTFMSENAFYPLVALWLLAVTRALERPTVVRQVAVFAVLGLAFLTRPQAVVLAPVLVATILLVVLLDAWPPRDRLSRAWRGLRAYWPTWSILVVGAVAAFVRQAQRDRPLNELLGSYGGVTSLGYERDEFGSWALYHLAEADIFLGVFPLAAFFAVTLAGLRAAESRSVRI